MPLRRALLLLLGGAGLAAVAFVGCALAHRPQRDADPPAPVPAPPAEPHAAPPGVAVGDVLRIGAWNIEWLGTPQSRSGPARGRAQAPEDLAEYITAARVDVLGLAEIARDDAPERWTNPTLGAAFEAVRRLGGGDWRHRLFPARSGRNQLTGVAWNAARVAAVGDPRKIVDPNRPSSQGSPLWSRPAHGQMFTAGPGLTDFVVVVVHMKSDYGGSFAVHRGEEAALLVAALPQAFDDGDVVVLGDFNCSAHDEPGARQFVLAGMMDLNAADQSTHWRYGALDRAMVPADQPEFASRHFEVLRESFLADRRLTLADFKVRFSDHFMIVTELVVGVDDD